MFIFISIKYQNMQIPKCQQVTCVTTNYSECVLVVEVCFSALALFGAQTCFILLGTVLIWNAVNLHLVPSHQLVWITGMCIQYGQQVWGKVHFFPSLDYIQSQTSIKYLYIWVSKLLSVRAANQKAIKKRFQKSSYDTF